MFKHQCYYVEIVTSEVGQFILLVDILFQILQLLKFVHDFYKNRSVKAKNT